MLDLYIIIKRTYQLLQELIGYYQKILRGFLTLKRPWSSKDFVEKKSTYFLFSQFFVVPENCKINDKDLHKTFLQVSQTLVELKIYIISLIPSDSRTFRIEYVNGTFKTYIQETSF